MRILKIMLTDFAGAHRVYIACVLSPSYFYPHLFEKGLRIKAFYKKDEDNIFL